MKHFHCIHVVLDLPSENAPLPNTSCQAASINYKPFVVVVSSTWLLDAVKQLGCSNVGGTGRKLGAEVSEATCLHKDPYFEALLGGDNRVIKMSQMTLSKLNIPQFLEIQ
jgi:hypothetical protein